VVLAELEEIIITVVLPEWRANVPSLMRAIQIQRGVAPPAEELANR